MHRVGRVGVWRLDRLVLRREDARDIAELVPGSFEFGVLAIHEVGVLDAVAVYHREAVDIGFLGDGTGLGGADAGLGVCGQNSHTCDEQRGDKASQGHGDSFGRSRFPS